MSTILEGFQKGQKDVHHHLCLSASFTDPVLDLPVGRTDLTFDDAEGTSGRSLIHPRNTHAGQDSISCTGAGQHQVIMDLTGLFWPCKGMGQGRSSEEPDSELHTCSPVQDNSTTPPILE